MKLKMVTRYVTIGFAAMALLAGCQEKAASPAQSAAKEDVAAEQSKPKVAEVKAAPAELAPVSGSVEEVIRGNLAQARADMKVIKVETSPIEGLYTVEVQGGQSIYVDASGKHFVAGDLFAITAGGFVNLGEQEREGGRRDLMASLDTKDMIVFSPKAGTATKQAIYVFTDIDCGYCQKLHREVPAMNELGIEVRYMAYPRAGLKSKSYEKIATAWCADDPNEMLTKLKNRENVAMDVCDNNPVAKHFSIGQQVGVRGTPAIVTETGKLLPGYMPADRMAKTLGI